MDGRTARSQRGGHRTPEVQTRVGPSPFQPQNPEQVDQEIARLLAEVERLKKTREVRPREEEGQPEIKPTPRALKRPVVVRTANEMSRAGESPHPSKRLRAAPNDRKEAVFQPPLRPDHELKEIELLKRRLDELERRQRPVSQQNFSVGSPFSLPIQTALLPARVKVPQIPKYNGKTDPTSHIDRYISWMECMGTADGPTMCLTFPSTLWGRAQQWFQSLPPHSIGSWDELTSQFVAQFWGSRVRMAPKIELLTMRQLEEESLKSYIDRFTKQVMVTEPVSGEAMLMVVLAGLRPKSRFWWSVNLTRPQTYLERVGR